MNDAADSGNPADNPYQFKDDAALETFIRGVIDDAIAQATASPRDFGTYSREAARQITEYVLERFARTGGG
jgi:hypothetical protein